MLVVLSGGITATYVAAIYCPCFVGVGKQQVRHAATATLAAGRPNPCGSKTGSFNLGHLINAQMDPSSATEMLARSRSFCPCLAYFSLFAPQVYGPKGALVAQVVSKWELVSDPLRHQGL